MLHHHVLDDRLGEGLVVAPTRLDWLEIIDLRCGMVKLFSNLRKGVRPRAMGVRAEHGWSPCLEERQILPGLRKTWGQLLSLALGNA